ncbi:MAG: hypothetical protein EGQ34_00860 [Sutterella sp.]|nr:hypothetical protein [Sutterella sp.]
MRLLEKRFLDLHQMIENQENSMKFDFFQSLQEGLGKHRKTLLGIRNQDGCHRGCPAVQRASNGLRSAF